MPEVGCCPKCGGPLLAEAGTVFCPVCAMRAAFEAEGKDPELGGPAQGSSIVGDGGQITERLANPGKAAGEATRAPRIRYFGDYELLEEIARAAWAWFIGRGRSA